MSTPFNPQSFVQILSDAGFRKDRSVYQFQAQFLIRKFGRRACIISVYPGHYTACCASMTPNGYRVDDQIQCSREPQDLVRKLGEWGMAE